MGIVGVEHGVIREDLLLDGAPFRNLSKKEKETRDEELRNILLHAEKEAHPLSSGVSIRH